jgi:hypothetical protein
LLPDRRGHLLEAQPVETRHRQRREEAETSVDLDADLLDRLSALSAPLMASGSSAPQCAMIGCPGQTGQDSRALSQTVMTK